MISASNIYTLADIPESRHITAQEFIAAGKMNTLTITHPFGVLEYYVRPTMEYNERYGLKRCDPAISGKSIVITNYEMGDDFNVMREKMLDAGMTMDGSVSLEYAMVSVSPDKKRYCFDIIVKQDGRSSVVFGFKGYGTTVSIEDGVI